MTTDPPLRGSAAHPRLRDATWLAHGLVWFASAFVLFIMSGVIGSFSPAQAFPFFSVDWDFPALLLANTPTGGDTGAHVYLPAFLRDHLLPDFQLLGWSNDWYAGFPALYFYFPLPALATVLLDVVMPYGVAFKLVSIAGLVALPPATYYFVRSMGFARLIAAVAAVSGTAFLFMESFSIFGANVKSTLAGEFSFSWSFALSLVYLGMVVKDTRTGRGFRPLTGVVLALTALAHVVTTAIVVVASLPLLLTKTGRRALFGSWLLGFALAALWAVPFIVRILGGFTTDMGWTPVRAIVGDNIPGSPFPDELVPILAVAIIGMVWTLARRDDVTVAVFLTVLPLAGYLVLPFTGITIVYNARLLPYWYFGLFVFAGIAMGLAIAEAARRLPWRQPAAMAGSVLAALLVINVVAVGMHDLPAWVKWNFTGYEGKTDFPQYEALLNAVDSLPDGRVMWEVNSDQNKYGTPMALMLLPYWSEGHPSMEGVFFESSISTPFHFLNASEVSFRPSNPVRGIRYRPLDFDRAALHLPVFGIDYYVSFTPEATRLAQAAPAFEQITTAEPWTIFKAPDSSLVDIAAFVPARWGGEEPFFDAALEWYDDVTTLDHWLVEEGPPEWPQVTSLRSRFDAGAPLQVDGEVSDIVIEDERISFRTTAVGVPHLVKVSHFPNWKADGAEGPYRAAPSLMVVVPTEEEVELRFGRTWVENVGLVLTLGGIAFLVMWRFRRSKAVASVPRLPSRRGLYAARDREPTLTTTVPASGDDPPPPPA